MPHRLTDLTSAQIRMLIRLDDGHPHEDSVGVEIGELRGWQFAAVDKLHDLGLVKLHPGWRNTFWFRLTKAGRDIRMYGLGDGRT